MTPKEQAIKVITGCCATVAHEMARAEVEAYKTWFREKKSRKGEYKPMLDTAHWSAMFEDLAGAALDQLVKS